MIEKPGLPLCIKLMLKINVLMKYMNRKSKVNYIKIKTK